MKIGFVGLGIMGRPMALNLLRSGCELYVNDLNEAAVKALCDKGAIAASQAEIAESCEAVFTILPNGSIVHQVLLGENGMLAHMAPGTLAVDMSSVTPEEAQGMSVRSVTETVPSAALVTSSLAMTVSLSRGFVLPPKDQLPML